mmetsp:Transcript_36729/g.74838  ORF Transcript_36729/g.74838 Transcript_36729/m.74838 type:complete len:628 (+) Transcript_36729:126-2009(+)
MRSLLAVLLCTLIVAVLVGRSTTSSTSPTFSRHDADSYLLQVLEPSVWDGDQIDLQSLYSWKKDSSGSSIIDTTGDSSSPPIDNHQTCPLYLAQSSMPNAGLGIYSGVDVPKLEVVGNRPEVAIIFTDEMIRSKAYKKSLQPHYVWMAFNIDQAQFVGNTSRVAIPGIGSCSNAHHAQQGINARMIDGRDARHKQATMDRTNDVAAGAISDFLNVQFESSQDVAAGSELFIGYGPKWFEHRGMKDLPTAENYAQADHVLSLFMQFHGSKWAELPPKEKAKKWNAFTQKLGPKTKSVLPESPDEVPQAADIGSAAFSLPDSRRSIEWLEINGQCMGNMRAGRSTMPQAGTGAFATRRIKGGEVISPVPTLPITRESLLMDAKGTQQLILNYVFGRKESSILLYPYASTVPFINHGGRNTNARIQLSTAFGDINQDARKKSIDDATQAPLMLELVATRDIELGAEVLIDYGPDWMKAWKSHLSTWQPAKPYVVSELNRNATAFLVGKDAVDLSRLGARTACQTLPVEISREQSIWNGGIVPNVTIQKALTPCDIIARQRINKTDYYTVQLHNYFGLEENVEGVVVSLVPQWAIRYVDMPGSNNQLLTGAFRHEIMLPDGILPTQWFDKL